MISLRGPIFALLAALLFGVSPPLSKALLGEIAPQLLAGLLYLGSGAGLGVVIAWRAVTGRQQAAGTHIGAATGRWLAAAIFSGGIVAPVLLMKGLGRTEAGTASLLLNLEGVFTALIAWFLLREGVNRRVAAGFGLILLGGITLSWTRDAGIKLSGGGLLIVGACACWGLDNNFTRKVAHTDAATIAMLKGAVAGIVNVILARFLGATLPPLPLVAGALALGFVSYGLSLVLFILALRHVGAARTGAYFATAPFIGAIVATVFFHEKMGINAWAAGALMAAGVWLHLTESREQVERALESAR